MINRAESRYSRPMGCLRQYFHVSAAALLLVVGSSKVLEALKEIPLLQLKDPVFDFVTRRQLLCLTGLVEIVAALIVVLNASSTVKSVLLVYLSSNFMLYRLFALLVGSGEPCHCLGVLTSIFFLRPKTSEKIAASIAIYLLVGSCTFWISDLIKHPRRAQ